MNNRETQIGKEVRLNKFADLYFVCGFGTELHYIRIAYSPISKMYQAYAVRENVVGEKAASFTAITEASRSMRPVWERVQKFQKNPY